jgi:predicted Zn-dependent protease
MRGATLACSLAIALAAMPSPAAFAAELVVSTQPNERPAAGTDEAELWYAMERIERELQQSPRLVRDPALNEYLRSVLCKVTGEYCRDLRLYVLDVPWFNASMAPNGVMIIWTGSLLRMRNEAQLALVLGHEFGHYRERHTLQQWRKLKRSSAVLGTFGALVTGVGYGVAGMAANMAGMASMTKFSRDKEREADRIGFAQLLGQGYDPDAGAALWEGMLREEEARDYGKPVPVFATHPQTSERRDDLKAAAAGVANPPRELATARYQAATRPFLRHWLEAELSRRMYASSIRVIEDLQVGAPPEDVGLFSFYLGEAFRQRGKETDRVEAAKHYALAVTQAGAPPEAWREHGLSLRAAGNRAAAATALRRYLDLMPQADDLAFVASYLTELESPR